MSGNGDMDQYPRATSQASGGLVLRCTQGWFLRVGGGAGEEGVTGPPLLRSIEQTGWGLGLVLLYA